MKARHPPDALAVSVDLHSAIQPMSTRPTEGTREDTSVETM